MPPTSIAASSTGWRGARKAKLDVLSTEAVEAYAREVGPIDILVNVAGFVHHGTVLSTSEKDWDFSFDLNVKSMHRTIRAFLPGMLARAKEPARRLDRQYLIGRLVDPRPAEPLCLWRQQGGGDRADQIGRGRFHPRRHPLQCGGARHLPLAVVGGSRRDARQGRWAARRRRWRCSSQRQPMGRVADAAEIAPIAVYLAADEFGFHHRHRDVGRRRLLALMDPREQRNAAIAALP